jgi:hypothetical protein
MTSPTKEELDAIEEIMFLVRCYNTPKRYEVILPILTKYRDGELVEKNLSQKLKNTAVNTYRKIGEDKGLLLKGKNSYTGNEIADEIEKETEIGVEILEALLNLTIDLVKRDKRNLPHLQSTKQNDDHLQVDPLDELLHMYIFEKSRVADDYVKKRLKEKFLVTRITK